MQLHTLQQNRPSKNQKPRVGRGGKRGTSSGKGTKGQKSRSGRRMRPAERDYIQRLPKLRGFANKPISSKYPAVNVSELAKKAKDGVIDEKILGKKYKVLGAGDLKVKITVKGLPVSESAKKKIEKAGGKVE